MVSWGSSPRARGAGRRLATSAPTLGLIPAGAGSGWPGPSPPRPPRAHPRGRGERACAQSAMASTSGSSPRARGAAECDRVGCGVAGLIPAGAGSGPSSWAPSCRGRAHPRGRGERTRPSNAPACPSGSSPRARGAGAADRPATARRGLIPAGAGSGRLLSGRVRRSGAHPRGRGERKVAPRLLRAMRGSSPRARGAARATRPAARGDGLIPAGAGSGDDLPRVVGEFRAHPRGRGER